MVDSPSIESFSVSQTESLADEIGEKALLSLRLVYGLSCRILLAVYRQPHSATAPSPLTIIPLYQNAIDSGFELLLVETNSENYLLLIKELKQLLEQLKPLIHQNDQKVLLYYSFKIYEFEGAILEKTPPSTSSSTTTTAIASYQQAFDTWFLLANKYHYFGTGNGLLSSYKEGIRNLKKILFLSCWNGMEGELLNRKEIESIVYNATCVLFHLIKEAPLFHKNEEESANELFPLRKCQATSLSLPLHLSLQNLLSPFAHHDNDDNKIIFSVLSIYSQSEFMEIFLLFLNCFDQHQDSKDNNKNSVLRILASFLRPVLSPVDSIHDLDVFTPYFDVLNPSMVKYIYSTLRSVVEFTTEEYNQHPATSATTFTETGNETKGEQRKSIKRLKKVKKKTRG
jgi:hypothetical protein